MNYKETIMNNEIEKTKKCVESLYHKYMAEVTDNMIDGKYLIIFYEKGKHAYKAIIADKKIIVKYPFFLKFIRKGNVSSSEVQSILSILDTKLRQQKWSVTKLEHTGIGDVTSYKLSLTRNKR